MDLEYLHSESIYISEHVIFFSEKTFLGVEINEYKGKISGRA